MKLSKTVMDKIREGRQYRRNDFAPEIRVMQQDGDTAGQMIVEGHACTFNEEYTLYAWPDMEVSEQIDPHAFDECDMSDVIMQFDHSGRVFARTRNETLQVEPDEKGLHVRADLSKSALGPGVFDDIKSGVLDRMSFGFTVLDDTFDYIGLHEGREKYLRTIKKIGKLYDVSVVSIPANDGTDISARSYCDGVIAELEAERLKAQKVERRKKVLAIKLRTLGISEKEKEE